MSRYGWQFQCCVNTKLLSKSSIYNNSRKKAAAAAMGAGGLAAATGLAAPIAVPATAAGVFLATWAILTYRKS